MAEVLSLIPSSPKLDQINHESLVHFTLFKDLLSYLFKKGNSETDSNHPIVIILANIKSNDDEDTLSSLQTLSDHHKQLLLKYFFNHLNIIIIFESDLTPSTITHLNDLIHNIKLIITNRISRIQTWTGTGNIELVGDNYIEEKQEINGIISTMSLILTNNINKSFVTSELIIKLNHLIMKEINFKNLLINNDPQHLIKLSESVRNWSFPAHELSNDDLIYCVFIMLKYALIQVGKNHSQSSLYILNNNELLGFVFMVRDTYKNGNPFHNFRHAVDVLQACFHFLIRLDCLPQFSSQTYQDELIPIIPKNPTSTSTVSSNDKEPSPLHSPNHLNHLQTLGLLIAALGHDVGHPGVTNAFMIKSLAPTSLLYNERSVLESFHSSVFINKILSINWPSLLNVFTESEKQELTLREIIISSILATDMAEHFEYIERLKNLKYNDFIKHNNRVKLICSLLIKCADISNVTRPLRVSSQWAMVLAREFDEVNILEKKIHHDESLNLDLSQDLTYTKVPIDLQDILVQNPQLHKGQIFFINTFAENLFNNISELLPELKYTCDIIKENKEFWLNRNT
ncbi:nucleotide phosphodiesterase [Scheffersomyces coipomensis]|uniref:nucleotide phosphodiesterase n=1 Tax=Scheffersomyces coipomensis TaxID=1788519 RepID=UPI00315DCB29